uniref:Uncharacterized protein n=1 Tax=Ditylenchus dipsaci TaxID=166011 RepID=A0A915D1P6_9BILA
MVVKTGLFWVVDVLTKVVEEDCSSVVGKGGEGVLVVVCFFLLGYPASELLKFGVCSEKSLEDKARQYYRQKVSDDEKMKNLQERMKTEMLTRMKMRMKTRKDT